MRAGPYSEFGQPDLAGAVRGHVGKPDLAGAVWGHVGRPDLAGAVSGPCPFECS